MRSNLPNDACHQEGLVARTFVNHRTASMARIERNSAAWFMVEDMPIANDHAARIFNSVNTFPRYCVVTRTSVGKDPIVMMATIVNKPTALSSNTVKMQFKKESFAACTTTTLMRDLGS